MENAENSMPSWPVTTHFAHVACHSADTFVLPHARKSATYLTPPTGMRAYLPRRWNGDSYLNYSRMSAALHIKNSLRSAVKFYADKLLLGFPSK